MKAKFITEESLEKYGDERFLQIGDLLWNSTGDGTIGRVISYPGSKFTKVVADSHVTVVRGSKKYIIHDYLWVFTASPLIQNLVAGRVSGSTKQTELGTGTVKLMEFSLPPLKEQKAIVRIVNQLFKEVEELEQQTKARIQLIENFVTSALQQLANEDTATEWAYLQTHFKTFFTEKSSIKKLRESILQLAVQGKLTKHWRALRQAQGPPLEPATALLKRIKAEKEQLIKEKKIKKEKPLPEISDAEIPYELPEGWVWCRLKGLGFITGGGTPSKSKSIYWGGDIPWVSPKDMKSEYIDSSKDKITQEAIDNSSTKLIPSGSLLIVGRSGILKRTIPTSINNVECTVNQDIKVVVPFILGMNLFMKLALKGMEGILLKEYIKYGMTVHSLKYSEFELLPVAIPPLQEQKTIVEKVNALIELCDSLEKEIEQNTKELEGLMHSCLREVFEGKVENEILLGMAAEPKVKYGNK